MREKPMQTGRAASAKALKSKRTRLGRWYLATALSILGVVATVATWFWPHSPGPGKPGIYAVRVQVLDPQGRAVEGAKVRTWLATSRSYCPTGGGRSRFRRRRSLSPAG